MSKNHKKQPVNIDAREVEDSQFKVGQKWHYNSRPGEEKSTLTIVKVEEHDRHGMIIHVSLEGLKLKNPHAPGGTSKTLQHAPFLKDALSKSVTQLVSIANQLPDFIDGYNEWQKNAGGIWSNEVSEVIQSMEELFNGYPKGLNSGVSLKKKLQKGYYKTVLITYDNREIEKHLVLDQDAKSNDPNEPAFLSQQRDSKIYYGYPLIKEISFDGFSYGAVTDFLEHDCLEGCSIGEGFVEAPDGSRAGLFWEVRAEEGYSCLIKPDNKRWGIYYIGILKPIKTIEDMKLIFKERIPLFKYLYNQQHIKVISHVFKAFFIFSFFSLFQSLVPDNQSIVINIAVGLIGITYIVGGYLLQEYKKPIFAKILLIASIIDALISTTSLFGILKLTDHRGIPIIGIGLAIASLQALKATKKYQATNT